MMLRRTAAEQKQGRRELDEGKAFQESVIHGMSRYAHDGRKQTEAVKNPE